MISWKSAESMERYASVTAPLVGAEDAVETGLARLRVAGQLTGAQEGPDPALVQHSQQLAPVLVQDTDSDCSHNIGLASLWQDVLVGTQGPLPQCLAT